MPLKHRTETAYLTLLAIVIAVTGFCVGLLPSLRSNPIPSLALLLVTVLYPLVLLPFFRRNRADYEFRFLHWYPAAIVALWIGLAALAIRFRFAAIAIFAIGYLWSLPLVIFGIVLLVLFALHVVRRSKVRVGALIVIACLFITTSVAAHVQGWNAGLSAAIYRPTIASRFASTRLHAVFSRFAADSGSIVVFHPNSSYNMSPPDGGALLAQRRLAANNTRLQHAIKRLPRSGPEGFALVAVALFGLYCGVLHGRAQKRLS